MLSPRLLLITLIFSFLYGCGDTDAPTAVDAEADRQNLDRALLGTWETVAYNIDYQTYRGGDTAYTETIREADWGKVYGVRPPSTVFTSDGKLRRTYRMRSGEVANVTNGLWKPQGDSLLVIEPNVTYVYFPELRGDRLTLSGVLDLDRDGKADDTYLGEYCLVRRTR